MAAELTLGAEEELHLIDLDSWRLSARAPQLLARLDPEEYSAELQRTTVETNTPVVRSLSDLRTQIVRLRRGLVELAEQENLGVAAVGTAPRSEFADFELTATGRYGRMQEQYRLLVDEQLICGLQIHVGVSDRDLAVEIAQRLDRDLPVLLALSASSPYWHGTDTGYSSIRSIIWQRWPSAGATGPLLSAREYDELVEDLIASGVIADAKMAYFEVRPSSHLPTLELRVCDACPLVDDAVLIAGLFRAAVRAAELDVLDGVPFRARSAPIHRAAMWQAARGGLSGRLLDDTLRPRPVPAARAVHALVDRLRPQLQELGDLDEVRALAEAALARGNSADRQRAAFAERGHLDDVVRQVVAETRGDSSGVSTEGPVLPGYRVRAGDEAVALGSGPRPVYRDVLAYFGKLTHGEVRALHAARDDWTRQAGMTFRVADEDVPFEVDPVPRILSAHEWSTLDAGLTQRARALEAFLQDIYTDARILRDGVLPGEHVRSVPGWRPEATRLPRGVPRAPVMGFDLVRNEFGGWRVLEDNVCSPSGLAFSLAARELTDAVLPDLPRPRGLLDPRAALPALRSTLLASAAPGTDPALLSSGPQSSAWFEHRRLADAAGLRLVVPDEVQVVGGRVHHRVTGEVLGVLYLRLDVELADLRDTAGRPVGAEILDAAATGEVVLANAPGNGVADDKAMYCYVPEIISYYLRERPLLESVPTYRPADPAERRIVLERVTDLVTKPVDGYGGNGVLIGPTADAAAVAVRRAEIAARPEAWVAQEVVALSSHPSLREARLEPLHVDLRAFVHVTGTAPGQARLAEAALTRVAPRGSMVVNSSQGGGAKDTWIVAGAPEGSADVRTGG